MLLTREGEHTSCIGKGTHLPYVIGTNVTCLRCGMFLGPSEEPRLGSLLDY